MNHFRQGIKNLPEICAQHGVSKVVIAPGSRNAPLIFSFTAHPDIECLSITDERSAAYFALGLSQHSGKPVALVCTSGTAVLNFAPAISEAYYQNIPLLVFTADRPVEMIDQSDGQTIRQENIYANYIKAEFRLPVETTLEADLKYCDRQVSQAIDTAVSYPKGPVQINVPLREPIYSALPSSHSNPKIVKSLDTNTCLATDSLEKLKEGWLKHKRKMVLFGILPKSKELNELAVRLAKEPDVTVIAENLANITGENIITQPESLFSKINSCNCTTDFRPELLITVGHSVICKQLKIFLRNNPATEQWQIESSMPYVDTYKSLSTVVPGKTIDILSQMPFGQTASDFSENYTSAIKKIGDMHDSFVNNAPLSDMSVTTELLQKLPGGTVLHLANSTSVRWTQLYPARPDLTYYCNRGTSGIDGSLSTAVGYAYSSKEPTVFMTGDLAFIYDVHGLWNNYVGNNLKIIVLNNNGGNIFRFIGNKELMANSLEFFTTPHQVKIKALAEAYGMDYISCNKTEDLENSIDTLLKSDKSLLLEVFTDSDLNMENYKGYFKNIKDSNPIH